MLRKRKHSKHRANSTEQGCSRARTSKLHVRRRFHRKAAEDSRAIRIDRPASEGQHAQRRRQRPALTTERAAHRLHVVVGLEDQQVAQKAVQHGMAQAVGAGIQPRVACGSTISINKTVFCLTPYPEGGEERSGAGFRRRHLAPGGLQRRKGRTTHLSVEMCRNHVGQHVPTQLAVRTAD